MQPRNRDFSTYKDWNSQGRNVSRVCCNTEINIATRDEATENSYAQRLIRTSRGGNTS